MDIRSLAESKTVWFGISTAIILAMVYFADINEFLKAVRSAELRYLVPGMLFGVSILFFWGYTWHRFFDKMEMDIPLSKSLRIFLAGQFMNSITPLGQFGGEPFMAYIIRRNSEASYEKAFSAVVSADLINATPPFTFLIGGALYLLLLGSTTDIVMQSLYFALLATVVGGGFVYLLWFEAGVIEGGILRFLGFVTQKIGRGKKILQKIEEKLEGVEESFRMVGENPVHLTKTAIVAHIGFATQVLCLYFVMLSLGFVDPSFVSIYFVLVLGMLATFSPTPGGSGTFEAAMAGLITFFFSTSFALGLTVAILFRLSTYWPGILIGYISINTLENGH